jgi:pyruvate/2-oxoglutarate dehydrogenase complex dihydrolipoamide acyltransferase (E2) component
MARLELRLAQHGMGMSDAEVVELHKAAGDRVAAGEPIMTMESAKAQLDLEAPEPGTVLELLVGVGDEPLVGDLLVVLDTD